MTRRLLRTFLFAVAVVALSPTAPAAAQLEPPPTHLIQISLLAASKTGPDELADLPANTREAIDDVRQFLPFKSYRLLDTALLRAQRVARTTLTGPDDRSFGIYLSIDGRHEPGRLRVEGFEVRETFEPQPPRSVGAGDRTAPAAPARMVLLSSSFAADIGQTVVVGTSRLNGGDEAMMVLFTALP